MKEIKIKLTEEGMEILKSLEPILQEYGHLPQKELMEKILEIHDEAVKSLPEQ